MFPLWSFLLAAREGGEFLRDLQLSYIYYFFLFLLTAREGSFGSIGMYYYRPLPARVAAFLRFARIARGGVLSDW